MSLGEATRVALQVFKATGGLVWKRHPMNHTRRANAKTRHARIRQRTRSLPAHPSDAHSLCVSKLTIGSQPKFLPPSSALPSFLHLPLRLTKRPASPLTTFTQTRACNMRGTLLLALLILSPSSHGPTCSLPSPSPFPNPHLRMLRQLKHVLRVCAAAPPHAADPTHFVAPSLRPFPIPCPPFPFPSPHLHHELPGPLSRLPPPLLHSPYKMLIPLPPPFPPTSTTNCQAEEVLRVCAAAPPHAAADPAHCPPPHEAASGQQAHGTAQQ
ncbi:unnamed protein product [Closterium sp. NIES-54]